MPYSSDLLRDVSKLSPMARKMLEGRERIIENWLLKVRAKVTAATELPEPLLVDTLPAFLDNLAEALSPEYPRLTASESTTIAQEHGGERARLSDYNASQVIREYQLLRDSVIEVLNKGSEISRTEMTVIQKSFDEAICEAVTKFAAIHNEMREEFVATLTHDLRNPLGVIQMATELLVEETGLGAEGKDLIKRIKTNAKRADQMIVDLLDASALKSGQPQAFELGECNMLEKSRYVAQQMAAMHGDRFRVLGDKVEGYWDCDALQRVLENLCSNAVKYGETGKAITVSVKAIHGRAMLRVHNYGRPIPASEQEAIFQVFRRVHETAAKKPGWGLGLAFVRGFCEGHAGSVAVDSSPERGTTFVIDIPQDPRPMLKLRS